MKLTNNTAFSALRNVNALSDGIRQSFQSLGSGKNARISPAARALSALFEAQIDSLTQAAANVQDASSLLQTAQGGLNEISALVRDINRAAVAAANTGVNDEAVRQAYQSQVNSALQAIQNIATQTEFNGRPLLDGSASGANSVSFQVGAEAGQSVTVSLGSAQTSALGTGVVSGKSLAQIDVTTTGNAGEAISIARAALGQVQQQNAALGATQTHLLTSEARSLTQHILSLSATNSQMSDTDYGQESVRLTAQLLQQQAGLAILSQANHSSQQAFTLLKLS